jgi:hyperosmotically inducible protein
MVRALAKLILSIILVVGIVAFFLGYRWGGDRARDDLTPAQATPSTRSKGTSGALSEGNERARQVGAEIGERVATGASAAKETLTNGQITARIKSKMALDDSVSATAIDVDTRDGVVSLSGTVGSAAERERALRLARETEGVTSVVDRLEIR